MDFDPEQYLEQRAAGIVAPPPAPAPALAAPVEEENGSSHKDRKRRSRSPKRSRHSRSRSPRDKRRSSRSPRRSSRSPRRRSRSPRSRSSRDDRRYRDDRDKRDDRRDRDRDTRYADERRGRDDRDARPRDRDDRRRNSPENPLEIIERKRRQEEENFERDLRTVFVTQIHMRAEEKEVWELFSKAGEVSDVRIIKDQKTRKSKGIGYVEMTYQEDVIKALSLSGQLLMGFPVIVQQSQAEKNRAAQLAAANNLIPLSRVYISNLFVNVVEEDLKGVFAPFGELEIVHVDRDPVTKQSRGGGFVQFKTVTDAQNAYNRLNGEQLAGIPMQLSLPAADEALLAQSQQLPHLSKLPSGSQSQPGGMGELDDDAGLALNAQTRAKLMMQLGRGQLAPQAMFPPPPAAAQQQAKPGGPPPATMAPTPFVSLANMFSRDTPDDEYVEILEDVQGECNKFGNILKLVGDRNASMFYLRFQDRNMAFNAQKAMNGRWFAGAMIIADFVSEDTFHNVTRGV